MCLGHILGNFNDNLKDQIASASAVDVRNTLAAKCKGRTRLCTFGDFINGITLKRGDFDFRAERCFGERDRNFAENIKFFTNENGMIANVNGNVKITCRAAVLPALPIPRRLIL